MLSVAVVSCRSAGREEGGCNDGGGLEDVSNDKAIKREGIKRDKGTVCKRQHLPFAIKRGGTVPSPLNFRKAQKYSSAAEKRICVTAQKEETLSRGAFHERE